MLSCALKHSSVDLKRGLGEEGGPGTHRVQDIKTTEGAMPVQTVQTDRHTHTHTHTHTHIDTCTHTKVDMLLHACT